MVTAIRVAGRFLATFFLERVRRMIHKAKPELTLYLAEEALKNKFAREKVRFQEILELQRDCRDYLSTENLRKIYARIMKAEVTKLMVDAVYQSLSSQEQEFLIMKYEKKKQMVAISLALNLSLAQLHIRHHAILEKISEYMLYKLSEGRLTADTASILASPCVSLRRTLSRKKVARNFPATLMAVTKFYFLFVPIMGNGINLTKRDKNFMIVPKGLL